MDHLGHRQYKIYGTSGGAPYALALNTLASTKEVSGTLFVVPTTSLEDTPAGHSLAQFYFSVLFILSPKLAARKLRKIMGPTFEYNKGYLETFQKKLANEIYRKTDAGRESLLNREGS
jgi:hypothetical protein